VSTAAGDPGPLLDAAPCGWLTFADDGTVRLCNDTLLTLLGYERGEIIGRHVETLLTIGSRIFYQTHFFPLLRLHGRAEEIFLLLRARDGSDVGTLVNAARRERDGEWVIDCVLLRIVERRKFEDALLRAKREAEEARALAEASRRELAEANDVLAQQAEELHVTQQQLEEQSAELELQSEELRTINDELLERSEELERARAAAEQANHAKSEFLATMSHELRTPLNAISGYVQLLDVGVYGQLSQEQREILERVHRSQRHLLRLINDVLNLSRIEAGRLEYRPESVVLCQLVESVLPMIEPQLAARSIAWSADVPHDLVARADREKTEQVLLNLLSNASKFTPPDGNVRIEGARDEAHGRLALRIVDTGVGIPRERLPEVFEPFVQVDTSHARRKEGTGLGLAISRDLARGMGGDLTVESEVGRGSAFTLWLPRDGLDP
jgi:signal transduction histidine kinase